MQVLYELFVDHVRSTSADAVVRSEKARTMVRTYSEHVNILPIWPRLAVYRDMNVEHDTWWVYNLKAFV